MKMIWLEKLLLDNPLRVNHLRNKEALLLFDGLEVPENARCLEIGTGNGAGSLVIAENIKFTSLISIDVDPEQVKRAREYISKKPSWARDINTENIEFKTADAANLPFDVNSFDVIICFFVFEHTPNWKDALKEIYRVLKPGGIFTGEEALVPDSPWMMNDLFGHIPIKEKELLEAFEKTGLKTEMYKKGPFPSFRYFRMKKTD